MIMVDAVRERMTAAAFFELPETNTFVELIDGELIVSPSPIPQHQLLSFSLAKLVDRLQPDGKVFIAPMDVYFDEHYVTQPDILWVSAAKKSIITKKRIEGTPDLIIEIASPGTIKKDRGEKFELYQKYGVREYWMVDPIAAFIEVYFYEDGRFQRLGVFGDGDTFESKALGKTVELNNIFPESSE